MNPFADRERALFELEKSISDLRAATNEQQSGMSGEIAGLEAKYQEILREVYGAPSAWQKVHIARHPNRPTALDYISALDRFDELHGDRQYRDDEAIVGGFGILRGRAVMAIGQQRGRDTKENLRRNFGMVAPEGYRKVRRLVLLAGRFGVPVVTFVDTKGADPGISSEEHAQSEAIAQSLVAFTNVPVPVVATVIGEGGSGGALALAIADRVIMLEHSTYSVASPEGCAAILWKDATKADEAASHLKLTAQDLQRFGIVDEIVPEPLGGANRDPAGVVARVMTRIDAALGDLGHLSSDALLAGRYEKYRRIGGRL